MVAASMDVAVLLAPMAIAGAAAAALLELRYHGVALPVVGIGALVGLVLAVRNLVRQGKTGRTVGKAMLGLCLVSERNRVPVGPTRSVTRQVLHLLDVLPFGFGLLWPLVDRRRQSFADKFAATVVVMDRGWAWSGATTSAAGRPAAGSG